MTTPSLTALDHLEGMYACWCEGMHVNDLFGLVYRMMELRGILHDAEGIQEVAYYIDCFEYCQSPSDPAFCYECKKTLEWIRQAS